MVQHVIIELPDDICMEKKVEIERYSSVDGQLSIKIDECVHTFQLDNMIGTYIIKYQDSVYCTSIVGKKCKS